MLDEKKKILDKNDFLNERKNAKILSKYDKAKRRNLILSVFICIAIIGALYLVLDVSNVKGISVEGNIYLRSEDIINISGVTTQDKYIFTSPSSIENNVKTNPLIDICDVEKLDDQTIKITVQEKKAIGYSFEENENVLILADDSRLKLTKDNLYLIEKVPLIEGFSKDKLILIEKNLVDVDYKMINEISEIHFYPALKFQDHEIIMRDGNYIFTSVYGLNLLNKYYNVVSSYDSSGFKCYYIEDISGNAYTSACPWEPVEEEEKKEDSKQEQEEDIDEDIEQEDEDE